MKNIFKLLFAAILLTAFGSCNKVADLPHYANGSAVTLSSNVTTLTPTPADSLNKVLILSWTDPKYATASSNQKFIIEIDSSGRNFSHEATFEVQGSLTDSLTAKQINDVLLGWGFAFGTSYPVDIRVTSSYANNNEQYKSNVLTLQITPYVVPPKIAPPSSGTLFIVGSATAGGWGNPVPVPAQQFVQIDSLTYEGTFFLNGGGAYDILPVNGSWNVKYNVADASVANIRSGGDFQYSTGPGNDIPAPPVTGMYKIHLDFQHGLFSVTKVSQYGLMYVPGDYQGWAPATAPTLGSPANDGNYDGYINIPAGGTYQFKLNTTPDWSNSFGDGGGGTLSSSGGNMTVPGAGYYHIVANTTALTWSATKTTWSLIGSFAASNWGNDIDMVYNVGNNNWTATITTVAGDQFKFRANHDWGLNYGENGTTGSLIVNGDNIGDASKNFAVPAGTHTITLFLNNSGYYTCLIQ
jgi:hypothetical protein